MNFRGILLGATFAFSGCTCRARVEPVSRDDDAIEAHDAKHDVTPDRERFVIIGADVVDLASKKVALTLDARPQRSALDASTAYVWGNHRLNAIELPSGKNRWAYEDLSTAPVVQDPIVDDRSVYVAWEDVVYAFDRATGQRTTIVAGPDLHLVEMARVGRSLVVSDGDAFTFVDVEDRTAHRQSIARLLPRLESNDKTALCVGLLGGAGSTPFMVVSGFDDRGGSAWPDVVFGATGAGSGWPTSAPQITPAHLVVSGDDLPQRSAIIGLAKGTLDYDHTGAPVRAMVEDAAGAIEVVIAETGVASTFDVLDPKTDAVRSHIHFPCSSSTLRVATTASLVLLAGYETLDGGGCVVAVNRKDESPAWEMMLTNPNVAHSEYWNDVTLRVRGDELVAIGREAGAEHVDVFALANGDRRFAHLSRF